MDTLGQFFWLTLEIFLLMAYLMILFYIFSDLFRDHSMGGFAKALWILFLIFVPFLAMLIYMIARGQGMQERALAAATAQQQAQQDYVRSIAGTGPDPADQIIKAKNLLDQGLITQAEYDKLKADALASK